MEALGSLLLRTLYERLGFHAHSKPSLCFSVVTEQTCSDHKLTLVTEWICSCSHVLIPRDYPHGILDVSQLFSLYVSQAK